MLSIFGKLFQITINTLFSSKRVNSHNIDYGRKNTFINQGYEIKPRSQGPYVLINNNQVRNKDDKWIRFNYKIINLGSEPANTLQTHTEIYINNELNFSSGISATSIVPPDMALDITSQDPIYLVKQCTLENSKNKYILVAEYTDLDANKYVTLKAFYFHPSEDKLTTREEKAIRLRPDPTISNQGERSA